MGHVNRGAALEDVPHQASRDKIWAVQKPEDGLVINYIRPCVAEMLEVMIFVFIGTMSVPNTKMNVMGVAIAHGLTIALLIAGFGGISGGHINPAVTLGVTLAGGLKPIMAIPYIISQMLGAVIGAGICRGILGPAYETTAGGGHVLPPEINEAEAILCEMVITLTLVGTVLMTAIDSDSTNPAAPFAIGFAVLVGIMAAYVCFKLKKKSYKSIIRQALA